MIPVQVDWDLLERTKNNPNAQPVPRRDIVATDGMKLTLAIRPLTLCHHAGHTLQDDPTLHSGERPRQSHLVAEWGGTAFNWAGPAQYITPERPPKFWFETQQKSAERFRDIATRAGADIIIANHTLFDGTKTKIPALRLATANQSIRTSLARRASSST